MRTHGLHSLDHLLTTIRDPESRRLAEDAVIAYNGGAFRAAILSIWVAVCADLIAKLKELAAGGDGNAAAKVADLEQRIQRQEIRKLQEFENSLLKVSEEEFQLLLPHEATDLKRLRDDRHLCAHPAMVSEEAFFEPSAELARTHIVHAILHLLSKAPIQGKTLIARFTRDLLGGSLPRDRRELETAMRVTYLKEAKESAIESLAKALATALTGSEKAKFSGREASIAESLAALGTVRPDIYERTLPTLFKKAAKNLNEEDILMLFYYIGFEARVWNWLGEAGQLRLFAMIDSLAFDELVLSGIRYCMDLPDLNERFFNRVRSQPGMSLETLAEMFPSRNTVTDAIRIYGESGSFATAEERGVKLILPHAEFFDEDDLASLIDAILQNPRHQIISAKKTSNVLCELVEKLAPLIPETREHWLRLLNKLRRAEMENYYNYSALFAKLAELGVEPEAGPEPPEATPAS